MITIHSQDQFTGIHVIHPTSRQPFPLAQKGTDSRTPTSGAHEVTLVTESDTGDLRPPEGVRSHEMAFYGLRDYFQKAEQIGHKAHGEAVWHTRSARVEPMQP